MMLEKKRTLPVLEALVHGNVFHVMYKLKIFTIAH